MIELRDYQTLGIKQLFELVYAGKRKIIYQLPTGGGKTITFAGLVREYLRKYYNSKVLICVHREELMNQCMKTLKKFDIHASTISAGKRTKSGASVYVAMVETLFNRLKAGSNLLENVGLLIVDEVHIANFNKLYEYFPESMITGMTATPLAASKKHPLKNYFEDIVLGLSIQELIGLKNLVPNLTYGLKGISRRDIKLKRGEFDNVEMGTEYSKVRHLKNTVSAYKKYCLDEKTLIFNCNIDHSKLVHNEFLQAGYNSRHLDSTASKEERAEILKWFSETDNAILNSVGILTMGFDEPSIRNIIVNRSTMSLPLWLQMTGRGSRPDKNKLFFKIIDMGGNAVHHGDWNSDIDWKEIFWNPEKPSESVGVAPIKTCRNCDAIIAAQTVVCPFCGYVHEREINYDTIIPHFQLITSNIDVMEIVRKNVYVNTWKSFFDILNKTVTLAKYKINTEAIDEIFIQRTFPDFERKVIEWRRLNREPYSKNIRAFALKKYTEEMLKIHNSLNRK